MRPLLTLSLLFLPLFAQETEPTDSRGWLNQGVRSFKGARFKQAVDAFERAVALDPANLNAHLYLATAYMTQWIPGAVTPENTELYRNAEREFQKVLQQDPNNPVALSSMASLTYNNAQSAGDPPEKNRRLDEAKSWNEKIIAADPSSQAAFYSLGVIAWSKFYPALMAARKELGMKPQDPGPLKDASTRNRLRSEFLDIINAGIDNLQKALAIDPRCDDAMAYVNLLMRERADLWDSADDYKRDVAAADAWIEKALATKRAKADAGSPHMQIAPPPPPPPGPDGQPPARIRVGGNVQAANLLTKISPSYPPEAKDARIQGTVRTQVLIGKDGRVQNIQLISGHPLLVPAAIDAVRQWVYKPTLLNGSPVEVITQVDVNFTLSQ